MHSTSVRCCAVSRLGFVLLLIFTAGGCKKETDRAALTSCGDKTVQVNTANGAEPEAVYVCEGDTVTWKDNGHKFLVEFKKKESPFKDEEQKFHNEKPKSDRTKPHHKLKVYEYRITVDGTVFDPQVIGGGGTP